MAECHVRFIYKRNAFLIILEAKLRFSAPKVFIFDRYYKAFRHGGMPGSL